MLAEGGGLYSSHAIAPVYNPTNSQLQMYNVLAVSTVFCSTCWAITGVLTFLPNKAIYFPVYKPTF